MTPRPLTASAPLVRRCAGTHVAPARRATALACTTLLLALASGCSVEVVDRRDADTSTQGDSTGAGGSETVGSTERESTTGPGSTGSDTVPVPTDPASPVATPSPPTSTVSCGADGTLVLEQASRSVALDEDCAHVTIEAADVQLTARAITTLDISAAGVVVHATSVGTLTVEGAQNTVVWDEGSPQITDDGSGNVLVAS